eukprot:jgi/Mesvir1/8660/Mv02603-RA.1
MRYMLQMLSFSVEHANMACSAFNFWAYACALAGGYIADASLGKFRTVLYFGAVYLAGMAVLSLSAAPFVWSEFPYVPGSLARILFFLSLFLCATGTGGVKSSLSTIVGDQLTRCSAADIEEAFRWLYWTMGAGSLVGQLLSPSLTNLPPVKPDATGVPMGTSFWVAYTIPTVILAVGMLVFAAGGPRYRHVAPIGSIVSTFISAIRSAIRERRKVRRRRAEYDHARPAGSDGGSPRPDSALLDNTKPWLDYADPERFSPETLSDLRRVLDTCRVFLIFPLYWLIYGQMGSNFIAQAGWLRRPGWLTPEQFNVLPPATVVAFVPLFDRFLYPFLRGSLGVALGPISRMAVGFVISSVAILWSAGLQHFVADDGYWPQDGNGMYVPVVHRLSVWWQAVPYLLFGVSEILASISALEFAYANAPSSMRSLVMSLYLSSIAVGSIGGMALAPYFAPENFATIFVGFGAIMAVSAAVFWAKFRHVVVITDEQNQGGAVVACESSG